MVKYEIKKILSRTGSRIALFLLGLLVLFCGFGAMRNVAYVNEQGKEEVGPSAIRKLKTEVDRWEGELTTEKLTKVLEEHQRISQTEEWNSTNMRESNKAFGWTQGYRDIYYLLIRAYCGFQDYDYYVVNRLTAADMPHFYENRIKQLQEWLDTAAKDRFNKMEKEFLLAQYQKLETPLYYEFHRGWTQLFEIAPTVQMIMVLILGYLLSGLFAREVSLKADAVFFTSFYGRNKAVQAKVTAGFLLSTVVYWSTMAIYSLLVLGMIGIDGAGCMIQIRSGWKSIYNITMLQEYLLILFGGYVGMLFFAALTMLISAKTKSAVVAVVTPFILIFLPSFLPEQLPMLSKIIGLMPDQLLQIGQALLLFETYSIGGKIMGSLPILFVGYAVIAAVLYPLVYRVFRRMEVK